GPAARTARKAPETGRRRAGGRDQPRKVLRGEPEAARGSKPSARGVGRPKSRSTPHLAAGPAPRSRGARAKPAAKSLALGKSLGFAVQRRRLRWYSSCRRYQFTSRDTASPQNGRRL